ncbi:OTU-domain-containing protein [Cryphonectria parasitica EP155]|uniref:OTU-domain-containing protein n=1 Tax=Cryphonectria parasitica (strain ATCC 38755 / EP155) TaxID=660469 RepID=A0A9P5CKL0_CRYP1|nr:OTU-domain-containing protein [Cryphonectria parasitica EP155]KAF3761091.1 OTU-domain-containing protein [Cryphonectria parasitica EP155]
MASDAQTTLPPAPETLEQIQARHRKEAKDLQGRITSKKKNATKKTRKGVNDECAEMERQMKERQAEEIRKVNGGAEDGEEEEQDGGGVDGEAPTQKETQEEEEEAGAAAAETGNGPAKKRNRQKERLARRAAEQEAAALAAEQEAARMPDHRAVEKTTMLAAFKKHGLAEHEIRPDGHCLFSAVADQLGQIGVPLGEGTVGEPGYKIVRRRAAGYIEQHGDEYAGFLEEDLGRYVAKMRDTAEWGGQLELLALASVYGVEIHVVQDRDTEVIRPAQQEEGEAERKRIWLAYYRHGYGLGEHYNSLRKAA